MKTLADTLRLCPYCNQMIPTPRMNTHLAVNHAQDEVRKVSEAHGAWCETCETALGCQYWSLSKAVALHRRGCPDHHVILWKWASV